MLNTSELIHEASARVTSREGDLYRPIVLGEHQPDGTWHGRIEFHSLTGSRLRATGRETSQVSRGALEDWATGLEPTYYEGAFERAV
jgi:hypothetical protein